MRKKSLSKTKISKVSLTLLISLKTKPEKDSLGSSLPNTFQREGQESMSRNTVDEKLGKGAITNFSENKIRRRNKVRRLFSDLSNTDKAFLKEI